MPTGCRAARPDIHDKHHVSTPLGWARYFEREQFVQLLEPITAPEAPGGEDS